jgi:inositol hexakisphosphate/diphosphoinositol-pentakisphosphate kinase
MACTSPTTSREDNGNVGEVGTKTELQPLTQVIGGVELSKTSSASSAGSTRRALPLPVRTKSHNLLSGSNVSSSASRKGSVVGAEQSSANIERISKSADMSGTGFTVQTDRKTPTPLPSKSSAEEGTSLLSDYGRLDKVLSRVGTNDTAVAVVDDGDQRGSSILPAALSSQERKGTPNSDRISFSSWYSIGSALYSGAANILPSGTSSSAGSTKGQMEDITPKLGSASTSPILSSEISSPPTTATDQTPVTTSSLSQSTGLGVSDPLSLTPNEQLNPSLLVSTNQGPQTTQGALNIPRNEADPDGRTSHRAALNVRPGRSRSRAQRRFSGSTAASSASREGDREQRTSTLLCVIRLTKLNNKRSRKSLEKLEFVLLTPKPAANQADIFSLVCKARANSKSSFLAIR